MSEIEKIGRTLKKNHIDKFILRIDLFDNTEAVFNSSINKISKLFDRVEKK